MDWLNETSVKRQMDFGANNGCRLSMPRAGVEIEAVEYPTYESNRQLAWARLVKDPDFRVWANGTRDSEFMVPAQVCSACGGTMSRGVAYNEDWSIALCDQCPGTNWIKDTREATIPPFTLGITDFHTPGGAGLKYEPEKVTPTKVVKGIIEKYGLESELFEQKPDAPPRREDFGIKVAPTEGGALSSREFVSALSMLVDFVKWANTSMKQGEPQKTREILDGMEVALGDFLQDPDGANLSEFYIPLGPKLAEIVKDRGGSPQGKKGTVRWEMSLAHIRNCLDRHTAAVNVLTGLLKPIMTQRSYETKDRDRREVAKQLARLGNVFSGDPERTVGNLAFPTGGSEPEAEVIWGLSRLGMLVHQADKPVEKMRLGEYIKYKRMCAGLSIREVARAAKMPPDKYRRIEGGDGGASKGDVSRIIEAIPGSDLAFALGRSGVRL
jgi:hypothetical protein